ncbi:MAG: 23S rRNA (adenine(2503)-C(2))-methyltransferase RlmN [Myxococcota bacterium]|jgi:23S rRNA (adenine2503-C2)-methyltransferase|nr:23S rRNA (adenine(2503)-C(2))-methyltransferase RlmN [Myxococcota bacterium]
MAERDPQQDPVPPLLGLSEAALTALAVECGEPSFRGRQLAHWLYSRRVTDPRQMSNLPAAFRERLAARPAPALPRLAQVVPTADGARKLLFALPDGLAVEGVLLPGRPGELTLCVSSQVGCPFDCLFCRTGAMGLQRNLTTAEILGQLLAAQPEVPADHRITRLVFMGMGEPLANPEALHPALHCLLGPRGLGFGPRRITVSTAGFPGRIRTLHAATGVRIAVSLGGCSEEQRAALMPRAARRCSLAELLAECRSLELRGPEHVTCELVLIAGVDDGDQDARNLVRLTHGLRCKINLIPLNEGARDDLRRPSDERLRRFQQILVAAGRPTSIRRSLGSEQLAACGQLATAARPPAD